MRRQPNWWSSYEEITPHSRADTSQHFSRAAFAADLAATLVTFSLAYLASLVAWFWVLLSQMAFDGCSSGTASCNYEAGTVVLIGHPLITATVIVFGTHWSVLRRRKRRLASAGGLGTLGGVLAVFFVAELATQLASGGRLF
jgi:hypothetical protein